jgi:BlaI family penicillinase repressor
MNAETLGPVELEIMQGVWRKHSAVTVRDVLEVLYPDGEKAYTTVQTIMNILAEKGVLSKEKVGMVNFYSAVMSRQEAMGKETQSLASRLFKGSFGELATYLVESGEMSSEDLDALRKRIERHKREGGADA